MLSHVITSVGAFDGTTERGRATASIGAANAVTRVSAKSLGDYANGLIFIVNAAHSATDYDRVEFDAVGRLAVTPRASGTALQVAAAINTFRLNPTTQQYPNDLRQMVIAGGGVIVGADNGAGTGVSAAATGSTTLAGGLAPTRFDSNRAQFEGTTNAGLFSFDSDEPLVLVECFATLAGSVAWSLTLRELSPARGDLSRSSVIASGTATNALVFDKPVIIQPGWGLGFAAATTGRVHCIVKRA